MADERSLLRALRSVAYEADQQKVGAAVREIRALVSAPASKEFNRREVSEAQLCARRILRRAERIVRASGQSRKALMEMASLYMGQYSSDDGLIPHQPNLECRFVVRYSEDERGHHRLVAVGPVDAGPDFLVGYAFWKIAKARDLSKWLKLKQTRCDICKGTIDNEEAGRPRLYCRKHERKEIREYLKRENR